MPLYIADASILPQSLSTVPEEYLVFYSSIVDGELWCPDCVNVDALVKETFGASGPAALIVYVGDRQQWKTPTNIFRDDPWKIQSIPTIVKLKDGKEVGRVVDSEIPGGLAALVAT